MTALTDTALYTQVDSSRNLYKIQFIYAKMFST